ncbi:hypothetical protein DB345_19835 [Spartobacteria bacterium LR76]|nr:hypothetical protein DB345_19835 [Spartobacteria bacterium LR76]
MKVECQKNRVQPAAISDALEELGDKWFRPEFARLLRLEDESAWAEELNFENLPRWAGKSFFRLIREFSDGPGFIDLPGLEFVTSENFGEILGNKYFWAGIHLQLHGWYVRANPASKHKLETFLGGPDAIEEIKAKLPDARKIYAIKRKAFARVERQSLIEKGRFFKGFGRGLLISERLQKWGQLPEGRTHKRAYMDAYIFFNWQEIARDAKQGGWPLIHQKFQDALPANTEISEDSFEKALKRANIGPVGQRGRPKISGQESAPMS